MTTYHRRFCGTRGYVRPNKKYVEPRSVAVVPCRVYHHGTNRFRLIKDAILLIQSFRLLNFPLHLIKRTHARKHARTRARTHTHTHTHTHTYTHTTHTYTQNARTHTRTHARTHAHNNYMYVNDTTSVC